jgi:hypothetical protein
MNGEYNMNPGKLIILIVLAGIFHGCSKETSSTQGSNLLKVSFRVMANGQLVNHTDDFLNGSGETYTVSLFKFYTGNYALVNSATQGRTVHEGYYLSNMDDPASLSLDIPLQGGSFNQLSFIIGVDSLHNVSGAQTGALDPVNGMFWTWNTGYIFAKFEGKSSFSTALNQSVVYHIVGFRQGENAIRKVTLDFPGDQVLAFGNGKKTEIVIDVNLDQWFDGVNRVSIASTPVWMTPGGESLRIADNYATMFSVHELINQ